MSVISTGTVGDVDPLEAIVSKPTGHVGDFNNKITMLPDPVVEVSKPTGHVGDFNK